MKYILSLFVITIFAIGCESTEPVSSGKLYITTEDVSCTEAWIKVIVNDVALPAELQLFRNDSAAQVINLSKSDTIIYDDNLAPSTEYNYTAKLAGISSGIAAVRTMDTTSHDFTWETYTFGGGKGSSTILDVAIIDENNIWAVGEIYTEETYEYDSNGVWVEPYNAVHWDGNRWELLRIADLFYPRSIVYAFDENDIWFDGAIKWNGEKYEVHIENYPLDSNGNGWRVNGMWGVSSSDFYVVGNGGNIAHYNGSSWKKIESGTDLDIYDIWGDYNSRTGEWEILAVAAKILLSLDRDIIRITPEGAEIINQSDISQPLRSVWFESNKLYMVAGGGNYIKRDLGEEVWSNEWKNITRYFTNTIRGTATNNIIIAGAYGDVMHYNGVNWKSYMNKELPEISGEYYSISIKENIVCLVGQKNASGLITIGRKN